MSEHNPKGLDPRVLRVTIDLSGELHCYELRDEGADPACVGLLAISAKGTKFTSSISNVCDIRISNIDKDVRDKLLSEGTPYARLSPAKNTILIEAGRVSTDLHQVYKGDIITVGVTQAPDITLVMRAMTGKRFKLETTTISQPATAKFSLIAKQVAGELGVPLDFTAPDSPIANFSFSGSLDGLIGELELLSVGIDVYLDDDRLIVKPRFEAIDETTIQIDSEHGLIGIPEFIGVGVRCIVLLKTAIRLGQKLRLTSAVYPAVDGTYVIYRLDFDLASRDSPFFYILEATRPDLGRQAA